MKWKRININKVDHERPKRTNNEKMNKDFLLEKWKQKKKKKKIRRGWNGIFFLGKN